MSIAKPTSFPYLDIAKRHGLDYAWVLRVADVMANDRWDGYPIRAIPEPAQSEILGAVARFSMIQQGIIKPF